MTEKVVFLFFMMVMDLFSASILAMDRQTYKSIRDDHVVKQNLDFSCGAAAMATLLTYRYQHPTTEEQVLTEMGKTATASFYDLKVYAEKKGYQVQGLACGISYLYTLKYPAIVYLNMRGQDHFVVFNGAKNRKLWLLDPSRGNALMSESQFLGFFKTRNHLSQYGRILVVMPSPDVRIEAPPFPKENPWIYDMIRNPFK